MRRDTVAPQLLEAARSQWPLLLAVVPGLALTMLHSTALDLPRADLIDALDSDRYRIQWITGSYILGGAVGMAMTAFLASRVGLRRAYLLAIVLFSVASGAGAAVSEVIWMAPVRLAEGFGTGLAISAGMVLIWRAFPVHRELAMAIYAFGIYLPAIAGAPIGGLLTAWISWRVIFLINLPLGCLIALLAWRLLPPDNSDRQEHGPFDWMGLVLLAGWVVTLNVVLDMGQYWGWLASPFFVPWFVGLLVFSAGFVAWGVATREPLINLRTLGVGHFALGLGIKVLFSVNLYVLVGQLSGYLINLRGYQWWQGSLVLLPAAALMLLTLTAGAYWGTTANRKARMFVGLALMAVATWRFTLLDLYTARSWEAVHLAVWGAGAGLVCGPALLTTFEGLSTEQTMRTAGIFNIMRTLPALMMSGVLITLLTQRADTNFDWLRQNIRINRPIVAQSILTPRGEFVDRGSGRGLADRQARAFLGIWVHANARALAFRDVFELMALVPACGLVLVLLVRLPGSTDSYPTSRRRVFPASESS